MNRIYVCALTLLVLPLSILLLPVLSFAYVVTPPVIDVSVSGRDIINETVTLTNSETKMVRIYPTVNEISAPTDGSLEVFQQPTEVDRTNTVTSWVEVSRGRIELQPGETREVPIKIAVHPEAEAGEYHVFVGFPSASNKPQAQALALKGEAQGTVLRIAVDAARTEFLDLEGFAVERFVVNSADGTATYNVTNTGDVPVVPAGDILFYNTRGTEVGETRLDQSAEILAPGESRSYTVPIPDTLSLGKYKAFLTLEYGVEQRASLTDTSFFYVVPWLPLLVIFLTVLFLALLLTVLLHRRTVGVIDSESGDNVSLYLRDGVSDRQDHDIDLSKK